MMNISEKMDKIQELMDKEDDQRQFWERIHLHHALRVKGIFDDLLGNWTRFKKEALADLLIDIREATGAPEIYYGELGTELKRWDEAMDGVDFFECDKDRLLELIARFNDIAVISQLEATNDGKS